MNNFWTDELVKEFATKCYIEAVFNMKPETTIESFKASKTKKDWEIVEFKHANGLVFSKFTNSNSFLYKNSSFSSIENDLLLNAECSIHAVRRLSDNVVFRVGDKQIVNDGGEIIGFSVAGQILYVSVSFGEMRREYDINVLKLPKQKIFTTHDSKEIFEGDRYFSVSDDFVVLTSINVTGKPPYSVDRTFSTREAAEAWLALQQACP